MTYHNKAQSLQKRHLHTETFSNITCLLLTHSVGAQATAQSVRCLTPCKPEDLCSAPRTDTRGVCRGVCLWFLNWEGRDRRSLGLTGQTVWVNRRAFGPMKDLSQIKCRSNEGDTWYWPPASTHVCLPPLMETYTRTLKKHSGNIVWCHINFCELRLFLPSSLNPLSRLVAQ